MDDNIIIEWIAMTVKSNIDGTSNRIDGFEECVKLLIDSDQFSHYKFIVKEFSNTVYQRVTSGTGMNNIRTCSSEVYYEFSKINEPKKINEYDAARLIVLKLLMIILKTDINNAIQFLKYKLMDSAPKKEMDKINHIALILFYGDMALPFINCEGFCTSTVKPMCLNFKACAYDKKCMKVNYDE